MSLRMSLSSSSVTLGRGSLKGLSVARYGVLMGKTALPEGGAVTDLAPLHRDWKMKYSLISKA